MVTQKSVRTHKKQSLLFDLCKVFDQIQSSHKLDIFLFKKTFFLHTWAKYYELPSYIGSMTNTYYLYWWMFVGAVLSCYKSILAGHMRYSHSPYIIRGGRLNIRWWNIFLTRIYMLNFLCMSQFLTWHPILSNIFDFLSY